MSGALNLAALAVRIALILCELGCEVLVITWAQAPPKGDAADCPPALYAELIAAAEVWEAPTPKTSAEAVQVEGDEPWLEGGHLPRTDLGNCQRFVAQYGANLRFVPELGWFQWTNKVWAKSDAAPHQCAADTVRLIYREAADEPNKSIRENLAGWAKASESAAHMAAIVAIASHDRAIVARVEDFNRDPWALNCLNGTVDLRTGALRLHRRSDLITMMAQVEFDPNAKFAPWNQFLSDATGADKDLERYVQRCVGYTLTGLVSEDEFYVLHGPGGTGKTTFIEAVSHLMGPYAGTLRTEAMLRGNSSGGHNEDVARLVGKRLVVMVEASEGEQLREGLIKQLTGGDRIPASLKGLHVFEFEPVLKLWLATNHVPRMPEDDSGMKRRFHKIPFEHEPDKIDKALRYVLKTDPRARAAELAWAVDGCLAWQQEGLEAPEAVTAATDRVWADLDTLKDFFEARLVFGDSFQASLATIMAAYSEYADTECIPPRYRVSSKRMSMRLRKENCAHERDSSTGRGVWIGVGVLVFDRSPDEPLNEKSK